MAAPLRPIAPLPLLAFTIVVRVDDLARTGVALTAFVPVVFRLAPLVAVAFATGLDLLRPDALPFAVVLDRMELFRLGAVDATVFALDFLRFRFLSSLIIALTNSSLRIECQPAMRFFLASSPSSLEV